jgi:hypothetical protein
LSRRGLITASASAAAVLAAVTGTTVAVASTGMASSARAGHPPRAAGPTAFVTNGGAGAGRTAT